MLPIPKPALTNHKPPSRASGARQATRAAADGPSQTQQKPLCPTARRAGARAVDAQAAAAKPAAAQPAAARSATARSNVARPAAAHPALAQQASSTAHTHQPQSSGPLHGATQQTRVAAAHEAQGSQIARLPELRAQRPAQREIALALEPQCAATSSGPKAGHQAAQIEPVQTPTAAQQTTLAPSNGAACGHDTPDVPEAEPCTPPAPSPGLTGSPTLDLVSPQQSPTPHGAASEPRHSGKYAHDSTLDSPLDSVLGGSSMPGAAQVSRDIAGLAAALLPAPDSNIAAAPAPWQNSSLLASRLLRLPAAQAATVSRACPAPDPQPARSRSAALEGAFAVPDSPTQTAAANNDAAPCAEQDAPDEDGQHIRNQAPPSHAALQSPLCINPSSMIGNAQQANSHGNLPQGSKATQGSKLIRAIAKDLPHRLETKPAAEPRASDTHADRAPVSAAGVREKGCASGVLAGAPQACTHAQPQRDTDAAAEPASCRRDPRIAIALNEPDPVSEVTQKQSAPSEAANCSRPGNANAPKRAGIPTGKWIKRKKHAPV